MVPPQGLEPKDRFLGITPELDHTAATQVEGFKRRIQELCDDYNASPLGAEHCFDSRKIWQKMTGYLSDHAPDQKKVFRELETYHWDCNFELLGETAMLLEDPEMEESEMEQVLDEKGEEMMKAIGGPARWVELPEGERLQLAKNLIRDAEICLGERAWERLPEELKEEMGCYWSGCGMHKDLNAVKGGVDRMSRWWEVAGKTPPIALMNKFKAGAGSSSEAGRSERGGIKLTNLVGALVKHKDPKKGQQDRFRTFSRNNVGYEVHFPDTSNTRYQSHTRAATEILCHPQLYLDFLTFLENTKTSTPGQLNHMEENIRRGLLDKPTFTEIIVLALYGEAFSAPFARFLRSSKGKNGLDLGPDYDRFKQYLQNVIDHPDLLIGLKIDSTTGTLDGLPWQNVDVIRKIEQSYLEYPDLAGALVAFFQGALDKLEKFTEEFKKGSPISMATPEQRWRSFRLLTNDKNEGSLGMCRLLYRRYSNIRFGQLNAWLMCK